MISDELGHLWEIDMCGYFSSLSLYGTIACYTFFCYSATHPTVAICWSLGPFPGHLMTSGPAASEPQNLSGSFGSLNECSDIAQSC